MDSGREAGMAVPKLSGIGGRLKGSARGEGDGGGRKAEGGGRRRGARIEPRYGGSLSRFNSEAVMGSGRASKAG